MFLYTVATREMVFPPSDCGYTEMKLNNKSLSVCEINGKKVVSRLFSTNQRDYLNPDFTPGRELS